jgi:hypothetical protein
MEFSTRLYEELFRPRFVLSTGENPQNPAKSIIVLLIVYSKDEKEIRTCGFN